MVRLDPMNERGPTPYGGRPPAAKLPSDLPTSLFNLRPAEEYEKMWLASLADLELAVARIKAYIKIGLPGANQDELEDLLNKLLEKK